MKHIKSQFYIKNESKSNSDYAEISSLQDQQNAVDSAINISDDTLSKLDRTFKSKIVREIRKSHLSGV